MRCKGEGSVPADSMMPTVPICLGEGVSQDMELSVQNQGKFCTNQGQWSLAESQVSGLGSFVDGETWNVGAGLVVRESNAPSFRHDMKYLRLETSCTWLVESSRAQERGEGRQAFRRHYHVEGYKFTQRPWGLPRRGPSSCCLCLIQTSGTTQEKPSV